MAKEFVQMTSSDEYAVRAMWKPQRLGKVSIFWVPTEWLTLTSS